MVCDAVRPARSGQQCGRAAQERTSAYFAPSRSDSSLIVRLRENKAPEQAFGVGETKARIDKLAPRRNQQRTSEIVGEQAEPQQNERVTAHQATHAGAITHGPRPGYRAAQHVAPRVMDMQPAIEAAPQAGGEQTQNEICLFAAIELRIKTNLAGCAPGRR